MMQTRTYLQTADSPSHLHRKGYKQGKNGVTASTFWRHRPVTVPTQWAWEDMGGCLRPFWASCPMGRIGSPAMIGMGALGRN